MTDCISHFFDAWQLEDANARRSLLDSAVTTDIHYSDPRTPETLVGIEAVAHYLAMFSANAPGWTAKVVRRDTVASVTRVTVAFSGEGPDGSQLVQWGQYFVEQDGDLVSRMVGFVGTGEPN